VASRKTPKGKKLAPKAVGSLSHQIADWQRNQPEQYQQQLLRLYKDVVNFLSQAPKPKNAEERLKKKDVERIESEILDDLEPHWQNRARFYRALCDLKVKKPRGRPRQDEEGRRITELRKTGLSWGQIGKGVHGVAEAKRKLFQRFTLRKGQKPN
jgi:hypothetical protein